MIAAAAMAGGVVGCGGGDDAESTTGRSTGTEAAGARSCAALAQDRRLRLDVDGLDRTAVIHAGPTVAERRRTAPVVIVLHGYTGSGAQAAAAEGVTGALDAAGFVGVFPDGLDRRWHFAGLERAGGDPDGARRDERFFAALLDRLERLGCVDPDRIFAVGFSMGGGMASALSCLEQDRLAGIGLIAAQHVVIPCPSAPALPVISMHALDDEVLPYRGGAVPVLPSGFPPVRSILDVVAASAKRNGCAATPRTRPVGEGGRELRFTDCDEPVVHLELPRGGHRWFGVGERRSGVDATDVVLDFLGSESRRGGS